MTPVTRRSFLKNSAILAGASSLFLPTGPTVLGNVVGANDRVRIALIGGGGRGMSVSKEFIKVPNTEYRSRRRRRSR